MLHIPIPGRYFSIDQSLLSRCIRFISICKRFIDRNHIHIYIKLIDVQKTIIWVIINLGQR